jgi:hypothetical protein
MKVRKDFNIETRELLRKSNKIGYFLLTEKLMPELQVFRLLSKIINGLLV